jgi:hypothetical protein
MIVALELAYDDIFAKNILQTASERTATMRSALVYQIGRMENYECLLTFSLARFVEHGISDRDLFLPGFSNGILR